MKTNADNRTSGVQRQNKKTVFATLAVTAAVVVLVSLVSPLPAEAARERYIVEFDDVHIRGQRGETATIFLKKAFRQQYPWVELADMDLRKVVLVAKSRKGNGGAQLRVGEWLTDSYTVAGRPVDFRDRRKITFDRVRFNNPSSSSGGPWQIDLQGNFIVRKVVLEMDNYRWRHRYYGRKHHYNRHHFNKRYYSRW